MMISSGGFPPGNTACRHALKSSPAVMTVLSEELDPEIKKAAEILAVSLGLKHNKFVTESELDRQMLAENDILVIGSPGAKISCKKCRPGSLSDQIPFH